MDNEELQSKKRVRRLVKPHTPTKSNHNTTSTIYPINRIISLGNGADRTTANIPVQNPIFIALSVP